MTTGVDDERTRRLWGGLIALGACGLALTPAAGPWLLGVLAVAAAIAFPLNEAGASTESLWIRLGLTALLALIIPFLQPRTPLAMLAGIFGVIVLAWAPLKLLMRRRASGAGRLITDERPLRLQPTASSPASHSRQPLRDAVPRRVARETTNAPTPAFGSGDERADMALSDARMVETTNQMSRVSAGAAAGPSNMIDHACPSCGAIAVPSDRFCCACGHLLPQKDPPRVARPGLPATTRRETGPKWAQNPPQRPRGAEHASPAPDTRAEANHEASSSVRTPHPEGRHMGWFTRDKDTVRQPEAPRAEAATGPATRPSPTVPSAPTAQSRTCATCDQPAPPAQRFCVYCGAQLDSATTPQQSTSPTDATDEALTVDEWVAIARQDVALLMTVARSANAPAEALRVICDTEFHNDDLSYYFWEDMSDNRATPAEILRELADGHQSNVGGNPSTPADVLRYLAANGDDGVPASVARNPSTPVDTLRALATSLDPEERGSVAENPSTPTDVLRTLATDHDSYVRAGVAGNPATPVGLLRTLASDDDYTPRKAVAKNPATPIDVIRTLTTDRDLRVRTAAAQNVSTPADALRTLATDPEPHVRYAVAANPSAPADALQTLASDPEPLVRHLVGENPGTPVDTLRALATDHDMDIRGGVAKNASCPVDTLRALATDHERLVRHCVGKNPGTPIDTLRALATDHDSYVRESVAGNPSTPTDALRHLATDLVTDVRKALVKNPATPVDVLRILASDEDDYVRASLVESESAPASVLRIIATRGRP